MYVNDFWHKRGKMTPYKHSEISVKKRGGKIKDYYPIHSFLDSTKEICSDNRHRILHTLWGVRRVVIPIFGEAIKNSSGDLVNVKDICEQDHILPDFSNKFIPTLHDFVRLIKVDKEILDALEKVLTASNLKENTDLQHLLLSPFFLTGELKSLIITHNSWFLYEVLPQIIETTPKRIEPVISPEQIFLKMEYKSWLNNGETYPVSAKKIEEISIKGLFD